MNYYKQFAEMLGLELEQEFYLTDDDGKRKDVYKYKITENGIFYKSKISEDWFKDKPIVIEELLNGCIKAVPKPWKPKYGDAYWRYQPQVGNALLSAWLDDGIDFCRWKVGNCFRTKEEAETKGKEIMEQLQKEFINS